MVRSAGPATPTGAAMHHVPSPRRAAGAHRTHGRVGAAALVALGLAGLLGPAPATAAAACTMTATPWGPRLTGCNLKDFFPDFELDVSRDPTPATRPLANLRIPNASFFAQRLDVELQVQVQNTSPIWAAAATSIGTIVTAQEVGGTQRSLGWPLPARTSMPALQRASTRWQRIATLTLPDRKNSWDICLSSTVDPPTRGSAVGLVMETDETDNTYGECCRLYPPTATEPAPDAPGPC
jgi:hypothetical protein